MANGDEYKPKNLLSLLPDKQEIFDSMGNGYNAMDVITSAVAQLRPDVTNGLGAKVDGVRHLASPVSPSIIKSQEPKVFCLTPDSIRAIFL